MKVLCLIVIFLCFGTQKGALAMGSVVEDGSSPTSFNRVAAGVVNGGKPDEGRVDSVTAAQIAGRDYEFGKVVDAVSSSFPLEQRSLVSNVMQRVADALVDTNSPIAQTLAKLSGKPDSSENSLSDQLKKSATIK